MIDETVEEISEMQTHSSSVVAVRAARALKELLDREFANVAEFERDLDRNSSVLRRANPSHASLLSTQRRIVETVTDRDATRSRTRKLRRPRSSTRWSRNSRVRRRQPRGGSPG
jgi:translation initiation factor eIF-2B subunit delta